MLDILGALFLFVVWYMAIAAGDYAMVAFADFTGYKEDGFVYCVRKLFSYVLIVADALIVLSFVFKSVRNAWE